MIVELTPKSFGFTQNINRLINPVGHWDRVNEEHEKIKALQVESYTLINKFNKLKEDCKVSQKNLKPIRNLMYILMCGFFIAVIYPLHFLPMSETENPSIELSIIAFQNSLISFKGIFLILLSIAVVSIFGYFLYFIS